MVGNACGGFEDDPMPQESYSQLLFGDDQIISGLQTTHDDGAFGFTVSSSFSPLNNSPQKMLCFGDYENQSFVKKAHNSEPTLPISNVSEVQKKKKKRKGPGIQKPGSHSGAPRNSQKPNSEETSSTVGLVGGHAKGVRKVKLGDRITALQQIVSPFGKTDTASVLHEAFGYIRFLQDQVHALCSPYLQRCPTSSDQEPNQHPVDDDGDSKKRKNNLRSQGLCLVPLELTLHVADSNGADLWSSVAMVNRRISPN